MDNPLKATLDAIGEEDNEIGGLLLTRLRQAHIHGRDNGELAAGTPTRLISPEALFTANDIGRHIDLLVPWNGTPSGNEGTYVIATLVNAHAVTLLRIDGTTPAFTTQKPVRWRISDLRVETTLDFPARDPRMQVFVGEEPHPTPYCALDQTPGAQRLLGLGSRKYDRRGYITGGALTTLNARKAFFTAADVGRTVWVMPLDHPIPNGNEGAYRITAVAGGGRSCTVNPAFDAAETNVSFAVKTYDEPDDYLSGKRPGIVRTRYPLLDGLEVTEGSGSYSAIDKVRSSFFPALADQADLGRLGRSLGVPLLPGMDLETYRDLIQVLPYLPKTREYGLELLMDALYPGGGWRIYEDLINFPATVFILVNEYLGGTSVYEGKTFMFAGRDVAPPTDPALGGLALGSRKGELRTSTTSTTVAVATNPITVASVTREDVVQTLEMGVLPSAEAIPWTFQAEADSGPVEADIFSVLSTGATLKALQQVMHTAASDDGGRYKRTVAPESFDGAELVFETFWKWITPVPANATPGFPWGIRLDDVGRQLGFFWGPSGVKLAGTPAGSIATGPAPLMADSAWHLIRVWRRTVGATHLFSVAWDGVKIFEDIDSALFPVSALNEVSFGYFLQAGSTYTVTAAWDRAIVRQASPRNYANVTRGDGVTDGTNANLASASNPFIAGDAGKNVRILSGGNYLQGLWRISAYIGAGSVTLEGITRAGLATVSTVAGNHYVELLDALFIPEDLGKALEIIGSVLGNNSTRTVLEVINLHKVRVSGAAFVPEASLSFRFRPWNGTLVRFPAATALHFEVVGASTHAAGVITLRDALPAANTIVTVDYTSVLSAQLLRDETIENEGADATPPNRYFPFYVFDVDRATKQLVDDVTASGVIPKWDL